MGHLLECALSGGQIAGSELTGGVGLSKDEGHGQAPHLQHRIQASGLLPADHRLGLENFQCVQYSRSRTIDPRKHQAVNIAEGQSRRGFAPQHVELVSKDKDLGLQRNTRPEQSNQGAPDQPAKIAHRERVSADSRPRSAVLGLR